MIKLTLDAKTLKWTLEKFGLSDPAISAAWPEWWSDDAEASASAQTELRFSLARKLGLDPKSLLEEDEPRFVWKSNAKFKHLTSESELERAALTSFGTSIARSMVVATELQGSLEGLSAGELREKILKNQKFVRLVDLLGLCWAIGIPIIYLKVFPHSAKRMCAMTARVGSRFAILLGKDAQYPAPIAYYVAHELGHIALGHLKNTEALIDLQDPLEADENDEEELAADRYALELLTGRPEPVVEVGAKRFTAAQLGRNLLQSSQGLRVEPGTLALCFGHSTGDWAKAYGSMGTIYTNKQQVWTEVNRLAAKQLEWSAMTDDIAMFMRAVMGGVSDDVSSSRQ